MLDLQVIRHQLIWLHYDLSHEGCASSEVCHRSHPKARDTLCTYSTRRIHHGLVVGVFDCGPAGRRFNSALCWSTLTFLPVVHDWINNGLDMSSGVCVTGHIKHPVPLIEKSRASCPSGRFPPSFFHQVITITGLDKLYDCMFSP